MANGAPLGERTTHTPLRIVVLANSSAERDARIVRSAEAAASAGHNVTVLGLRSFGLPAKQTVNRVDYVRLGASAPGDRTTSTASRSTRRLLYMTKALGPAAYLLLRNAVFYQRAGTDLSPDIVHAHDLYTLYAGWLIARRTQAKLVYDSHELERGRAGVGNTIDRFIRRVSERLLIRKAAAVITVSDSIADDLASYYRLERPVVVHNTPREAETKVARDVRTELTIPSDTPLAVYIGGVTFGRGLVQMVEAMPMVPDLHLALVGPRTHQPTEDWLRALAKFLRVEKRLHFVDPVPAPEVTQFVRTADLSLVLIQDTCLSYHFSFPNKLLESLFAGLPIVASKLPEYEAIIAKTNAGVNVDQADPVAVAEGIKRVLSKKDLYTPSAETIARMRSEYGWEAQSTRLLDLYRRLSDKPSDPALPGT